MWHTHQNLIWSHSTVIQTRRLVFVLFSACRLTMKTYFDVLLVFSHASGPKIWSLWCCSTFWLT
jgi:hypothetical protein